MKKFFPIFIITTVLMGFHVAHADITSNLQGWWKLDDGTGTDATDSSGNNILGGLLGSTKPSWTAPGKIGAYDLTFNGSTSYVNCTNASALNPAAITISAWVNFSSLTNAYNAIVSRTPGSGYYQLFVKSNGKLAVYLNASAFVNYDGTGTYTLTTGTWYHLVVTYSSVAGLVTYVDNQVDKTVTANGALGSNTNVTTIGLDNATAGRIPAAQIDDVRIYNRALSASDVLELYNYTGISAPANNFTRFIIKLGKTFQVKLGSTFKLH
jgi:hypothetical protein